MRHFCANEQGGHGYYFEVLTKPIRLATHYYHFYEIFKTTLSILFVHVNAQQGGMWIPSFLKGMNESEMKTLGMKLTAEQIYSVNKSSLKDAVPQFDGGCTAEVISGQGLILTNHHCGFDAIQNHSSVAHDYLTDGFWAYKKRTNCRTKAWW